MPLQQLSIYSLFALWASACMLYILRSSRHWLMRVQVAINIVKNKMNEKKNFFANTNNRIDDVQWLSHRIVVVRRLLVRSGRHISCANTLWAEARETEKNISVNARANLCVARTHHWLWYSNRALFASSLRIVCVCVRIALERRTGETRKTIYWFKTFVRALCECIYLVACWRACRAYI